MKKAGVAILWTMAAIFAIPFFIATEASGHRLNYPQTAFWPLAGFACLMLGPVLMARGVGKDRTPWKIAGGAEMLLGAVLVAIARPLNTHTGPEYGSIPWSQSLVGVLMALIVFPQIAVFMISIVIEHQDDPAWGMGSAYRRELETVLKTRYVKEDYRGVRETVSTSSAIGRSLVGGAIGGDLGAIIGAGTARTKTVGQPKAVFIVWYKDGTDAVKTVKMNSPYYDLYLSKLER